MTLRDLLRQQCSEAEEGLAHCIARLRDLGRERVVEEKETQRLGAAIHEQNLQSQRRRSVLHDTEGKIQEVKTRIAELQAELDSLDHQRQGLLAAVAEIQDTTRPLRDDLQRAETAIKKLDEQISDCARDKQRYHAKLVSSRRKAVSTYLETLESRLTSQVASHQEREAKFLARRNLERARHEEPDVTNLYEARLELQRLLNLANVPAVRGQLSEQLESVESQIEARFPGALAVQDDMDAAPGVEEIYFAERHGAVDVFLPITRRTWEKLADGENDSATLAALRLIWTLASALQLSLNDTQVKIEEDGIVLNINAQLPSAPEALNFSMPLPGSGDVVFLLSRLPNEVEEALRSEDLAL